MTVHTKFNIEPFFIDFDVYFTDDPKRLAHKLIKINPHPQVADELKRDWLDEEGAGASVAAGMMGVKMDTYGIIAIFDVESVKENTYSYFAHEAGHILSYILIWTGAKYDPKNDEWTSYMLDYILRMIDSTYNKTNQ